MALNHGSVYLLFQEDCKLHENRDRSTESPAPSTYKHSITLSECWKIPDSQGRENKHAVTCGSQLVPTHGCWLLNLQEFYKSVVKHSRYSKLNSTNLQLNKLYLNER